MRHPFKGGLFLMIIGFLPLGILLFAQAIRYFKIPEDFLVTATFYTIFAAFLLVNTWGVYRSSKLVPLLGKSGVAWHFWLSFAAMFLVGFAAHVVAPAVKSRGFGITLTFLGLGVLCFITGQIVYLVNAIRARKQLKNQSISE